MRKLKRYAALIIIISLLFTTISWSANMGFVFAEGTESLSGNSEGEELLQTATNSDAVSTSNDFLQKRTTTYTVTFYDWDGTVITTQNIEAGQSAVAPANPSRQGFAFTGWSKSYSLVSSDLDIYAEYRILQTFTVAITYVFADGSQAAQPYVATVMEGYQLTDTIPSPSITGFSPDQASIVLNIAAAAQDEMYMVIYLPQDNTGYTAEHYLQDLDLSGYTLMDTDPLTGYTGESVTASARTYSGFSSPAILPSATVAADGSTTLNVYYTRDSYGVYFDTGGGSYIAPYRALYEEPLSAPVNPTRAGYAFAGWDTVMPANMPVGDITLTAQWTPVSGVDYTVIYWLENANDSNYSYVGSVHKQGTADALVSYVTSPVTSAGASYVDGVAFPISADYFAYDAALTETIGGANTQRIKGDGSTLVNVYFTRNVYTIIFDNMNNGDPTYDIEIDGVVYTGQEYQVRAKFDELIRFPIGDDFVNLTTLSTMKFYGWYNFSSGLTTYGKYLTVTKRHIDTMNSVAGCLSARYSDKTNKVRLDTYLQDFDGNYNISDTYSYELFSTGGTWHGDSINGYTWDASHPDTQSDLSSDIRMYYTLNKYDLTLVNGNERTDYLCSDSNGIFFGDSLAGYVPTAPSHPANIDADYIFDGWYTTQDCIDGTEFAPGTATMPASSLVLYAKWAKPEYTVTFEPDNGDSDWEESVTKGGSATRPADPVRVGYTFAGWYQGSNPLHYIFESQVTENTTLTARWIPDTKISYTVYHITDDNGVQALYQTDTYTDGRFGDTVTVGAIRIPGYLPDVTSQSCPLGVSGNDIYFYYTPVRTMEYTVEYREQGTGNMLAASEIRSTSSTTVTESFKYIMGYGPVAWQQTLVLTSDPSSNVITFYYQPNPVTDYVIEHYIQKVSGGYERYSTAMAEGSIGSGVKASDISIPHFTYNPGISVDYGILNDSSDTVLKLYYERDSYAYRVEYYKETISSATLLGTNTASGKYEATITDATVARDFGSAWEYAEILPGYSVKSLSGLPFDISDNTSDNVVYVVYTYTPVSASLTLDGWKNLNGNKDLEDDMFHFVIEDGNGLVVASGSNAASGMITFDTLTYTSAGFWEYTISEVQEALPGVTYDATEYKVTVKVMDDGDGNLVAEAGYPAEGIVFNNSCLTGGVRLVKYNAMKSKTLRDAKFDLYQADGTLINTYVTDSKGVIEVNGLPYGSYYFVETKAPAGYTLSSKHIEFKVNDSGTNTGLSYTELTATNAKKSGGGGGGTVTPGTTAPEMTSPETTAPGTETPTIPEISTTAPPAVVPPSDGPGPNSQEIDGKIVERSPENDDIYYVYDKSGKLLGYVIVPDGMTIEELDIEESILPFDGFAHIPKTSDGNGIIIILTFSCVLVWIMVILGFRTKKEE